MYIYGLEVRSTSREHHMLLFCYPGSVYYDLFFLSFPFLLFSFFVSLPLLTSALFRVPRAAARRTVPVSAGCYRRTMLSRFALAFVSADKGSRPDLNVD